MSVASARGTTRRAIGIDAQNLHGVDLFADLAGAEVGADRRTGGAGDDERGCDRCGLTDGGQHCGCAGERLCAELAGQAGDLKRDDRTEGNRHQDRRHQGDLHDEGGLFDVLAKLELRGEREPHDIGGHGEDLAGAAEERRQDSSARDPPATP